MAAGHRMKETRKLYVLWREPTDDGHRHVIGHLWEGGGEYHFAYVPTLGAAKARGFQALVEFPDESQRYTSRYLFPTFAQRVPSPARPDFQRLMAAWDVARPDDRMEILARSGGLQVTDRIELAPFRAEDDDLAEALEFRVAGARHRVEHLELEVGAAIVLRAEPGNPVDPHAVRVEDESGGFAGYVPRQYSALVARMVGRGVRHSARVVRELLEPGSATPRAVVRVERAPSVTQRRA